MRNFGLKFWFQVPDLETIDVNTHGFTKDGIPAAQDVVRADLVGGFALQKVTSTRSYFRYVLADSKISDNHIIF